MSLPKVYFGQKVPESVDIDSGEIKDGSSADDATGWQIQSSHLIPSHTGMIALGQRRHVEFCFVLKPSPGSRILDLVPHKQIPDIEDMRFVTD